MMKHVLVCILLLTGAVVMRAQEDPEYKIRLIDAPMVDISSTFIREGLQRGENMDKWLM